MPIAATQKGEASGSGPTPALRRRGKRSSFSTAQSAQVPSEPVRSKSRRKERATLELGQISKRRKRKTSADTMLADEEARKAKMRNRGREEEEEEEEVSSAVSSPLRDLHIPDELYLSDDPRIIEAIHSAKKKYGQKRARVMNLPTLNVHKHSACPVDDPKLLLVHESATKIMLCAAKSVVGLSSSISDKLLSRSSGFWIEWDDKNKTGIILTTAHLIRKELFSHLDEWVKKYEYAPDAKVIVRLWDDSTAIAHLLYYQKHYNLAFFRVRMNQPVQLLSFSDKLECAQDVFELGRDEDSFLKIGHGRVQHLYPLGERYHYMYIIGTNEHPQYHNGGPVIDLDGNVVGMVNLYTRGSFVPLSILLKCLHLWRKFRCIPRPHLGLRLSAISLLDPAIIEKISAKCKIDDGLVVNEVSERSHGENLGIREGDVIECFDGTHISTTIELENMLLSKVKKRRNGLNSSLDVQIRVLHVRKGIWRNKTLTVNVSDDAEVVARASDTLTREEISASISFDQMGPVHADDAYVEDGKEEAD